MDELSRVTDANQLSWHPDLRRYARTISIVLPRILIGVLIVAFCGFSWRYASLLNLGWQTLIPSALILAVLVMVAVKITVKIALINTVSENLAYLSYVKNGVSAVEAEVELCRRSRAGIVRIKTKNKQQYFKVICIDGKLAREGSIPWGTRTYQLPVQVDKHGVAAVFELDGKRYWCMNHFPQTNLREAITKSQSNQAWALEYSISANEMPPLGIERR